MFNLETKFEKSRITLAKNLSIGERENGASDEQNVRYVFFAGCSPTVAQTARVFLELL